jgi:hypothetical protein
MRLHTRPWLNLILLCGVITLLSGCSASWHVKRAQKKDPSLFEVVTVTKVDTVWIESVRIDTLFRYKFDTVEFIKDRVKIKYAYRTIDSLVYIDVECPPNEVITKTETITTTVTVKPTFWDKVQFVGVALLVLIAIVVFGYLVRKFL